MKIKYFFLLIIVVISALIGFFYHYVLNKKEAIHIAFVGPMNEGATAGKLMTQAIQLYLDTVNEHHFINTIKNLLCKHF